MGSERPKYKKKKKGFGIAVKSFGGARTPVKSKGVTIAPGQRYYGPEALRPSTPYKRGGTHRGLYDPKKYTDVSLAEPTAPKETVTLQPDWDPDFKQGKPKIEMSPGFAEKYKQALADKQALAEEQTRGAKGEKGSLIGRTTDWFRKRLRAGLGKPDMTIEQIEAIAGKGEAPKGMTIQELLFKGATASTTGAFASGRAVLSPMTSTPGKLVKTKGIAIPRVQLRNYILKTRGAGPQIVKAENLARVAASPGGQQVLNQGSKLAGKLAYTSGTTKMTGETLKLMRQNNLMNIKSLGLLGKIWATTSGKVAIITGGTTIVVGGIYLAASTMGPILMGMWSGTESPEGAQFPLRELYEQAQRLQDQGHPDAEYYWRQFDDAMALSNTLAAEADPSKLKNQIQFYKQFYRKWKQTRIGMAALTDSAEAARKGKTWVEIEEERKEEDIMWRAEEQAYYKRLAEEKRKATKADQAFWANLQSEKQEYWSQREKFNRDNMKSNLKFGLL